MQIAVIAGGVLAGRWLLESESGQESSRGAGEGWSVESRGRRRNGALLLGVFAVSVVALPLAVTAGAPPGLAVFDAFYRAGALVFGGGQCGAPPPRGRGGRPGLDRPRRVPRRVTGAAQALPGPLFTIAAFLGAHIPFFESPLTGALVALVAIFAPVLPARAGAVARSGAGFAPGAAPGPRVAGVNAAVVGLLLAALYDPVFTASVRGASDFAWVLGAFALLFVLRWPPWLVVVLAAVAAGSGGSRGGAPPRRLTEPARRMQEPTTTSSAEPRTHHRWGRVV